MVPHAAEFTEHNIVRADINRSKLGTAESVKYDMKICAKTNHCRQNQQGHV